MGKKQKPVVIRTPMPTLEDAAKIYGLSKKRVRELKALVDGVLDTSPEARLAKFLYLLMRFEVVPGVMESTVRECEMHPVEHRMFANKHIGEYAHELARRLIGGNNK
jgi:hypothetical protein